MIEKATIELDEIEKEHGVQCQRCGSYYDKEKGNFLPRTGNLFTVRDYYPICNRCIDQIFKKYLAESGDEGVAIHATCRKLNLYWSERIYNQSTSLPGVNSPILKYLRKLRIGSGKTKSYEDSLIENGKMWDIRTPLDAIVFDIPETEEEEEEKEEEIPESMIRFWGPGQTREEYLWLEDRYQYYLSRLDTDVIDVGKELLIKQLCNLESDINRGKAEGKGVEKSVSTLNNILGALEWKPSQLKGDDSYDKNPLGVWIKKFEDERPLPEVDPSLEDVDNIIHHVSTFFMGHLAKMLGLKNNYTKMYDDEMRKYTINAPDLEDMDEEDTFSELFEDWTDEE